MEKICDLSDIDILITDSGILPEIYERYSKHLNIIKA